MRYTSSNIVYEMQVIPVKIGNLQKGDGTGLKQISPCCKTTTSRLTTCSDCEKPLENSELLKGFPLSKTEYHIFSQEQIDSLKDFDDIIEVLGTIPKDSIDYRMVCGSFAVLPDQPKKKKQIQIFKKAYKVFERSVAESDKVIVVKFSTRQKQKLGIMTSINGVITLLHIVYDEQFNEIDEIPQIEISEAEKKQGLSFIEKLESIELPSIEDNFKAKLEALIENGEPLTVAVPEAKEEELSFFK